ncbi:MAG: hypothetical protein JSV48_12060, partial [Bradyrhizobium sp.]
LRRQWKADGPVSKKDYGRSLCGDGPRSPPCHGTGDRLLPTLYEAHHDILPVAQAAKGAATIQADVVGPVCETGDYLALDRNLPTPKPGDLLAIMTAGAYGAVQAGTYNTRPLVPEVLVRGDQYAVVRPRIEVEELIAMDKPAPWL